MKRLAVFAALAPVAACVLDGDSKLWSSPVPIPMDDGWRVSSPAEVGLSAEVLDQIHLQLLSEDAYFGVQSLLVIRDGRLVFEAYLNTPDDRDRLNALQSATKSVTSLAFGLARDRGWFPSLDETLAEIFPDQMAGLDPKKGQITLQQLLTMRSGIHFDNSFFSYEMWVDRPDDPLRYILDKPLYADPGARFYYRDADPQLIAYALERRTGRTERELVATELLAPLAIREHHWESGYDGVTFGGYGLHLRPRDFAKLGQLMLDHGRWNGAQVLSEAWCTLSSQEHLPTDRTDSAGEPLGYGFYWWVPRGIGFVASGHGGQFALVVPDRRLVVVQTALPDSDIHGSTFNDFIALVRPLLDSAR
jgi:CubicO group peptidase (beta-lactamase class C family)